MRAATVYTLLAVALVASASFAAAEECVCTSKPSSSYPDTVVLDCTRLDLLDMPKGCLEQRFKTSEIWLSYNQLTEVRSTTFMDFGRLRTLRLDNNLLTFVDRAAFDFLHDIEVFKLDHNLDLVLDNNTLSAFSALRQLTMIGSGQTQVPALSASPALAWLDLRSNRLAGLPKGGLLHPQHNATDFYVSLLDNDFYEIAASSLLDFPEGSTVYLDTYVSVWAQSSVEAEALRTLALTWTFNLNLATNLHVCSVDGLPLDATICN